jgi:hypothetical protein
VPWWQTNYDYKTFASMPTLPDFSLELDDGIDVGIVVGVHVNASFPKSCKKGGVWGLDIVGVGVYAPLMTFYRLLKTIQVACPSITFNCVNISSFSIQPSQTPLH